MPQANSTKAARDFAQCVADSFAVFAADDGGKFLLVLHDQIAEAKEDFSAAGKCGGAPFLRGRFGRGNGAVYIRGGSKTDFSNLFAGGGIHHCSRAP
jgi:hypothetical protein